MKQKADVCSNLAAAALFSTMTDAIPHIAKTISKNVLMKVEIHEVGDDGLDSGTFTQIAQMMHGYAKASTQFDFEGSTKLRKGSKKSEPRRPQQAS